MASKREKVRRSKRLAPGKVAVYYIEREEVKQALLYYAADQGHGSIGEVIREATKKFLDDMKFDWKRVA